MKCTKCSINLPLTSFSIRTDTGKHRKQCKTCRSKARKSHYENNKEHDLKRCKSYYKANKKKYSDWSKQYYLENKEAFANRSKKWVECNPEKAKINSKKSSTKFRSTKYGKFREFIRSSLRRKGESFGVKHLPYTVEQFVARIEFNFKEGMSWDNYGEWEIDHTKPVKRFYEQGKLNGALVNSLCNLKPLWKSDNRRKSDKFIK